MRQRFILFIGNATLTLGGSPIGRIELWSGIEIESEGPVDVMEFSREIGRDLVPADDLTEDELRSVGVDHFEALRLN